MWFRRPTVASSRDSSRCPEHRSGSAPRPTEFGARVRAAGAAVPVKFVGASAVARLPRPQAPPVRASSRRRRRSAPPLERRRGRPPRRRRRSPRAQALPGPQSSAGSGTFTALTVHLRNDLVHHPGAVSVGARHRRRPRCWSANTGRSWTAPAQIRRANDVAGEAPAHPARRELAEGGRAWPPVGWSPRPLLQLVGLLDELSHVPGARPPEGQAVSWGIEGRARRSSVASPTCPP